MAEGGDTGRKGTAGSCEGFVQRETEQGMWGDDACTLWLACRRLARRLACRLVLPPAGLLAVRRAKVYVHAAGTELQLDARSLGGATVVAAPHDSRRRWYACLARLARRASTLLLLHRSATAGAAAIPITAAATSAAAAACLQEQVYELSLLGATGGVQSSRLQPRTQLPHRQRRQLLSGGGGGAAVLLPRLPRLLPQAGLRCGALPVERVAAQRLEAASRCFAVHRISAQSHQMSAEAQVKARWRRCCLQHACRTA